MSLVLRGGGGGQAKSSGAWIRQGLLSLGSEDSLVPIADDDVKMPHRTVPPAVFGKGLDGSD